MQNHDGSNRLDAAIPSRASDRKGRSECLNRWIELMLDLGVTRDDETLVSLVVQRDQLFRERDSTSVRLGH